jgi:hypothetical protein
MRWNPRSVSRSTPVSIPPRDSAEDGPQLTGWGSVVGRYPDGKPAIVEGRVGDGGAILSGVHPEAPDSWRRGLTFWQGF